MSFEARFGAGSTFSGILEVLKAHISEGTFVCTEEGMSLASMDSSHISLVKLHIPASDFVSYVCKKPICFGVSLVFMAKIIKFISSKTHEIMMTMQQEGADELHIRSVDKETDQEAQHYQLKLMDIINSEFSIPPRGVSLNVRIPSNDLKKILSNLEMIGDVVHIYIDETRVTFSSKGSEANGEETLRGGSEQCVIKTQAGEKFSERYAGMQLRNFSKAAAFSDFVIIKASSENPLILTFRIFDHGRLQFYLAPLMDEKEETQ